MEPSANVRIVRPPQGDDQPRRQEVLPGEVEEILYTHPSVLHAAIVGRADPRLGERNCLCVIPRPGTTVSLPSWSRTCADGVAAYKLPEELEIFDEFPFTPTGRSSATR